MSDRWLAGLLVGALIAAGCTSTSDDATPATTSGVPLATTVETPASALPDLEVALVWHQHQPQYPIIDGVVSRPWVRLHAAKDYVDMAELIAEFPDLRATINLTPVLLNQLADLEDGARDNYWVASQTAIEELSPEQRQFITDRFFDVNGRVIDQFDRYVELRDQRSDGGDFDDQDLRDLRTLFNLAWLDPEQPEFAEIAAKDQNFSDDDTNVLLAAHQRMVEAVIPTHAALWESNQIEVITTPLAHPILPLIVDTNLARVGDPTALLPRETFREYADAEQHVAAGLDRAEELLGARPSGMWPGEGAVAQEVMPIFAQAGVDWVATGEDVLAQSLGIGGFDRDENDTVVDSELLYRPWSVSTKDGPVTLFFRDNRISDLIGFEYSGQPADEAVADLLGRLRDVRESLDDVDVGHQPLVTIVLDGENAWEHYPNDGKDFLRALYTALTTTDWITTTTPSAYLKDHPADAGELNEVFPAAWFSPDFGTWIGEAEEARAWDLLRFTRLALRQAEQSGDHDAAAIKTATAAMLAAEGSDWFWWYGNDQDSGDDRYFDDAYRELLGQVYDALGRERPRWANVPIIADPSVAPDTTDTEARSITLDGVATDWDGATRFDLEGARSIAVAIDNDSLSLRVEQPVAAGMEIYLRAPRGTSRRGTTIDDQVLGFDATHLVRWSQTSGACVSSTLLPVSVVGEYPRTCVDVEWAQGEGGLEISLPVNDLGALAAGDQVTLRLLVDNQMLPAAGPAGVPVPDIAGFDPVITLDDPAGDDNGSGSLVYPSDAVFIPGSYDLLRLEAGISGTDAVFALEVDAPIANPWGSPVGLSIQTFDIYLDTAPGGRADLLDGRNATFDDGWEAAITIEGWDSAVATAKDDGDYTESTPTIGIAVLSEQGKVTIRVPLAALPESFDPASAQIAVAVLSQEGFPSAGVRRVRDVEPTASQWRLGGGDSSAGTSRVIDIIGPLTLQ